MLRDSHLISPSVQLVTRLCSRPQNEETDEEDEEGEEKEDTSGPDYNYLLSMPMWYLTKEKKEELCKQRDAKVQPSVFDCKLC